MQRLVQSLVLSLGSLLLTPLVKADPLSGVALYYRCYGQLTQQFPAANDPYLPQVRDGKLNPIDACIDILMKASLLESGNQSRLSAGLQASSVDAFQTMHKVHVSWFQDRNFSVVLNNISLRGTEDIYDAEAPAFYLTRALFRPDTGIDSVITMARTLRALRTNQTPDKGVSSKIVRAETPFGTNVPFAATGELQGFMLMPPTAFDYTTSQSSNKFVIDKANGGGILGDPAYLRLTVNEEPNFKATGALAVPRKWSRAVMSDLMCRDIPAVRTADALAFRVANSTAEFRKESACIRCHATIDRMAGVIRGIRYVDIGDREWRIDFATLVNPTMPAGVAWPSKEDATYSAQPPSGVLYFRDYKGRLVNQPVDNLAGLGAAIAATDDFYICMAKRYYSYFMGVDVKLADPTDPVNPVTLSDLDKYHLQRVVDLGLELKADVKKSSFTLIKKILSHPDYGMDDYHSK